MFPRLFLLHWWFWKMFVPLENISLLKLLLLLSILSSLQSLINATLFFLVYPILIWRNSNIFKTLLFSLYLTFAPLLPFPPLSGSSLAKCSTTNSLQSFYHYFQMHSLSCTTPTFWEDLLVVSFGNETQHCSVLSFFHFWWKSLLLCCSSLLECPSSFSSCHSLPWYFQVSS